MKWLDRMEELLIASLMAGATALIFISVLHRYASGFEMLHPLTQAIHLGWAEELCIIAFVWMAKFGAAYGVRTGIHVGVDVLINKLSDKNRSKFIVIGLLAGTLFTGIVGTLGATFVWEIAHTDQTSADLEMPMWIVYLAVPLGSYLMSFRFLQVMVNFLKTGELPKHDHSHVEGMEDVADDSNWFAMDDNLHPHDLKNGGDKK